MSAELGKLAAEAFFYGYPIVANNIEVSRVVSSGFGAIPPAPFNTFGHAKQLAGPRDTFVTVNNDTLYSIAPIDLSVGPVVLHVPDTKGRYYVLQFVDAWSNNFAYVGKRATGTGEGEFLLVPPGWAGKAPEGMTVIHAPTRIFTIVGRNAVEGDADIPNVLALQKGFTLRPLEAGKTAQGMPTADPNVPDELKFWENLRVWMQGFPPSDADQQVQKQFAPLGLLNPTSPYINADPGLAAVLKGGYAAAEAKMEAALKSGAGLVNGWNVTMHIFDYNLDFFEVGALNDPMWKIKTRPEAYVMRTIAARAGLWGNHAYEALYALTYVDDKGEQLNGAHQYELKLSPPPPVAAFWSLTMYNVPKFFLVANSINRYSIGDRTPGLKTDADGSVTIYMQKNSPGADKAGNWLPTPDGDFRPALRMYQPNVEIFGGEWKPPAIQRVG